MAAVIELVGCTRLVRSRAGPVLKGSGDMAPSIWCLKSLTTGAFRGIILDKGTSSSFLTGVFDGYLIGDLSFFFPSEASEDVGFWVSGVSSADSRFES